MKTSKLPKRILLDQEGTSIIELCLFLPILMVLAFAAVDFVGAFSEKLKLQQYAQAGADFVVAVGDTPPATSAVKAEVVSLSGLAPDQVSVTSWTECNQSKNSTYDTCPNASDVKASYMKIDLSSTYEPFINVQEYTEFVGMTNLSGSVIIRLP